MTKSFFLLAANFFLLSGVLFAAQYPNCDTEDITIGDYTLAACNVGSSVAGTGEESYGAYFQWGNNYPFFPNENYPVVAATVDASLHGPGNAYTSGAFLTTSPWETSNTTNLWGGQGDTLTGNGPGTDQERQGPCAAGYHVPSTFEWRESICSWLQSKGESCPPQSIREQFNFTNSTPLKQFQEDFLLPLAGELMDTNGTIQTSTFGEMGAYRSSTRLGNDDAVEMYVSKRPGRFSTPGVQPQRNGTLNRGWSLRCFKNTPENEICNRITDIPKAECKALVDFYHSTNGDGWTKGFSGDVLANKSRLTGTKVGDWRGITVSGGHISDIRLDSNNLSGTLNPSLGNLPYLENFIVYNNHLGGGLPVELQHWKKLKGFLIASNSFSGQLPKELGAREDILMFEIWDNQFEGTLPPEYGTWNVQYFAANNNKFTGTLPDSYGNWTELKRFDVAHNQLYGTLPNSYANRTKMAEDNYEYIVFSLQDNLLSGDIPEGIKNWSFISGDMFISNNCFNASLTGSIGNFLDTHAAERPLGDMLGTSRVLVGSGRRLTQNHCLSVPTPTVPTSPTPTPSSPSYGGGGGGGGGAMRKDYCPNGDFSPSYYDGTCGDVPSEVEVKAEGKVESETTPKSPLPPFRKGGSEVQTAYDWAFQHSITTLVPLEAADPEGPLLRSHLAKMMVNYAVNVLGISTERNSTITPLSGGEAQRAEGVIEKNTCVFNDLDNETEELKTYMTLACQLGIMGIHTDGTPLSDFMPNKFVSRAEFGTVLSRVLYGTTYNDAIPYYVRHLQALQDNGIMTQIDNPEEHAELRQWVWVMLMRNSKKGLFTAL